MSSSVIEGLVHECNLMVHIAENGHSFEPACDGNTLVEAVMRYIESISGINFNDQLVLCSDMKLESKHQLSTYKLPSDDREVFIFNKGRLQLNSSPPPPEQVDIPDVAEPPSPSSSHNPHPLDDASDPALKALPSYERQFRYHYQCGHAIYSRTQVKYEICERLLREQRVQERAVEVARSNLDQYYKMINQNYSEFIKRYSQQHRIHSDLLMYFARDVERLRSVKLHPALQTSTRSCMLDFVKEESLRKSADICSNSHKQFENKVSQFKNMFDDVKRKVEELFSVRASLPFRNLEMMIKEHHRYINEQKSIMQSLSKDVTTVKKLVVDCLSSQLSSSLRPHDAVSALGPMYDVHDKNHLPKMQACDQSISKLLDFCKDKKDEMNIFLHNYLQKITYISHTIKDVKLQFPVFKEAMLCQDDLFLDLKLVRGIGPAYRACLAEIVRRKASMKLYMGMAGQLAERLATKRESEVTRREEFLKAQSSYIPRDVLGSMGLYDNPNQCEINIVPFDSGLLDIDISDVERFAPEFLVGLAGKNDKGSMRGSFSISNDSSHSDAGEDISVEALEKYYLEDLLEGDLVDIAGTSKIEVENARLKAELASAIAQMCSFCPELGYECLDDSKLENLLKSSAEKTAEALHLKDEYVKHLQNMLRRKQMQCASYEKRIQELEQRLSDQYIQEQKNSNNQNISDALLALKADECKQGISYGAEAQISCLSTSEPMDEVSCISNSLSVKLGLVSKQSGKAGDGIDENMMDSSGMASPKLDSLMLELQREELQVTHKDGKDNVVRQLGMSLAQSSTAESMPEMLNALPSEAAVHRRLNSKFSDSFVLELQKALAEKSNQLSNNQTELQTSLDEVGVLKKELEMSRKLLDESQMNCAHLENCLHEVREEAQTHRFASNRWHSRYNSLRASAVKLRSLFERLCSCVYAPGGASGFSDSLHALAQSLANSMNENEDDDTREFQKCIRVLAERVSILLKEREKLLDKFPKLDATNDQLRKELEEKKELVKTLYTKHQFEKQTNKEKITVGRLEVHEIAAFVLNSAGHYEAINRTCLKYYLSAESVALFADYLPNRPNYIVGQIVHIESQIVKSFPPISTRIDLGRADQMDILTSDSGTNRLTFKSGINSNPYGLPIGCEYYVVTVAMLPDTTIHSSPPS